MRKVVLVLVAVLAFNLSNAQWTTKFYVDDFGEPTKESYQSMVSEGVFSNSATQNSKALYAFIKSDDNLTVKVLEYGRSLATSIEATFETVKLKTPNGVVEVKKVFFSKSGRLYFSKDSFKKVSEAMSESGDYIMVFDRSGRYSNSSYKVKFSISN